MGSARTADARLSRLLHILPAAKGEEGVELEALATTLESTVDCILEDIEELTSRVFYRPGGWPDDVQIFVEGGRVRVHHATGFERPVRLTRDETLCLAIALRGGVASTHEPEEAVRLELLKRIEAHLAVREVAEATPSGAEGASCVRERGEGVAAPERDDDPDGIRATLLAAKRDRTPCAIWYVKAGATDGSVRVIHPYAIAYAEGAWYVVGHCTSEESTRVFRLDRVLACDAADGSFEVPEDFRVEDVVTDGRVFHTSEGGDVRDVRVRYSPRIARWIRERGQWEPDRVEDTDDGGVLVRHEVADPHWAIGHALLYGAEAEIVEPADLRGLMGEVLRRMEVQA